MNNTPAWLRKYWDEHPVKRCDRAKDGGCDGRLTKEHAWIYAGKQIQEVWAVIDLCWHHHLGTGLNKNKNQLISLRKATEEDLAKYPKKDWNFERRRLEYIEKLEKQEL